MILPTTKYEKASQKRGFRLICGVDEVGRGALAGPLVAAAVILPDIPSTRLRTVQSRPFSEVRDSKLLIAKKREELSIAIKKQAVAYSFGIVEPAVIDRIGITRANQLAMREAIEGLTPRADIFLIDFFKIPSFPDLAQIPIKKGDQTCFTIAAASIIAKVYRDELMVELSKKYPQYFWERNKGYGTFQHLEAIISFGASPHHRLSFLHPERRI